ncbi:MAG TPA: GNAT family protein [Pyrinomonadaceae bacterium]|nr:GNAT family protein [Pyrinomonadaceae bacterium]
MLSVQIDENITLELPQPHHAEEVAAVVRENLERLKIWMPWAVDDYSVESARFFIQNNLKSLSENGSFGLLIKFDGRLAGSIGFHDLDKVNRSAHIGYWIAKDFEGRGIMTRCCRVLIGHLFHDFDLNRVQINCNVENTRSRAIPERLGFKLEGVHRQVEWLNGQFGDWAVYAMLQKEWKMEIGELRIEN